MKKLLIVLFFAVTSAHLCSQNGVNTPKDSIAFTGITKFLLKGMPVSEFQRVDSVQWQPVGSDSLQAQTPDISLEKQLTYSDLESVIIQLSSSSLVDVYVSSIKSEDHRQIYCMEIGSGEDLIVFTAGVHAREIANPQFLLKFIADLVSAYERKDSTVQEILSRVKLVIMPCVNPDGYDAAIRGKIAVNDKSHYLAKCNNIDVLRAKSNARGVDLNRNFPSYSASALWKGKVESTKQLFFKPAIYFYPGMYLGSERETKVAMNFLMRYIPSAVRYVDFHSAGRIIFAGKPHLSDTFNIACTSTGKLIESITKYRLLGLDDEESGSGTDGSITDFASEIAAGYTFNATLGRLAPPDTIQIIQKSEILRYSCSVNTVETLRTLNTQKPPKPHYSTPQMHLEEWTKFRLKELFYALLKVPKI